MRQGWLLILLGVAAGIPVGMGIQSALTDRGGPSPEATSVADGETVVEDAAHLEGRPPEVPPVRPPVPPIPPRRGIDALVPVPGPHPRPPVVPVPDNLRVETVAEGTVLGDLFVPEGVRMKLPAGALRVSGDVDVQGVLDAPQTDLHLDGSSQSLRGKIVARRIHVEGGVKLLQEGARVETTRRGDADPAVPELVVAAGTTLVVGKGSVLVIPDPYGYQVAGRLEVDGGTVQVRFANGNGKETADSWLPGSELILRGGTFQGSGDHDFRGASLEIHGGALRIDDDLWSLGDRFLMTAGEVRNSAGGGAFGFTGRAEMTGGTLLVHHSGSRGLALARDSDVDLRGGRVKLLASRWGGRKGRVLVGQDVTLPDVDVQGNLHVDVSPGTDPRIWIEGTLRVTKGVTFQGNGHVDANEVAEGDEHGTFER